MTPPLAEAERGQAPEPGAGSGEAGLRAIVLYKTIKAGASLAGALTLVALVVAGRADAAGRVALWLGHHVAYAWAARATAALASLLTLRHVALVALALAFDAALTSLEAWALRTRRPWGEWLVVAATGLPLPYEAFALAARVRAWRALLFAANLAVVVYLGRRALGRALRIRKT